MATSCILPQPHTTQLLSNHHEGKLLDFRDLFPFGEPSFTVRSQNLLTAVTFLAHWIQKEIFHFGKYLNKPKRGGMAEPHRERKRVYWGPAVGTASQMDGRARAKALR